VERNPALERTAQTPTTASQLDLLDPEVEFLHIELRVNEWGVSRISQE
jgi:hypothetical protein